MCDYHKVVETVESNMLPCFFKKISGFDCVGCGMQRSIVALFKGNIWESIVLYPGLMPLIITIVLIGLNHFSKSKLYSSLLFYSYIFTFTLILLHYIIKMIITYV